MAIGRRWRVSEHALFSAAFEKNVLENGTGGTEASAVGGRVMSDLTIHFCPLDITANDTRGGARGSPFLFAHVFF